MGLRHGGGLLARLGVAIPALVALAAILPVIVSPRDGEKDPPLQLIDVAAVPTDEQGYEVSSRVFNERDGPRRGRVWWLLATPGEGPDWSRRVYRSSVTAVLVPARSSVPVHWNEQAPVPSGTYELSAWVHVEGANGFVHSDHQMIATVRSRAEPGSLLREGPPRFAVSIDRVTVERSAESSGSVSAEVVLRNPTSALQRTQVRAGVVPAGEAVTADWWRRSPVAFGPTMAVSLPSQSSETVTVEGVPEVSRGRYAVVIVLEPEGGSSGDPLDEVAVASPIPLPGSGPPSPR